MRSHTVLVMPNTATLAAGSSLYGAETWCATLNTARVMLLADTAGIGSARQLARESGVARRLLNDALHGAPISLLTVARIAAAVGSSPAGLIVWTKS